ncbi:MAG: hypothetical protein FVQ81_05285 [Candidatus Glassbacteria bacterium]|nr:hypothetical protein [Candidatus Glassbacteria bacterium]
MRFFTNRTLVLLTILIAGLPALNRAATLDNHPHWKYGGSLPGLYYEVLAVSFDKAERFQAPDGRYRSRIPADTEQDVRSFSMYIMQYIYVPALLYVTEHEANPLAGNRRALDSALSSGDWMASIVNEEGLFVPVVDGVKTNPLDSHRALYCWAEVYGLLKNELGAERERSWREALHRGGQRLCDDMRSRMTRPRITAPFLGTSPNHFGLWCTTVNRIGMLLGLDDWVEDSRAALARFVREVAPGGYWAEHDGPTVSYDYLNTAVGAYYWHYYKDPEALDAIRANTDFHAHWTTPDGIDISTVDQRNRNHYRPRAGFGLFSFSNFPAGRRLVRLKLLAALEDKRDPFESMGLSALGRLAQDAHYHSDGPEAEIPQQIPSYRHTLAARPAVVRKNGNWVYSICALVSPDSPLNQFFLDRIMPVSLWHTRTGAIIGGGNSKGQPGIVTFAAVRNGDLDAHPLDGLLRGSWDGDTLCVAEEGFSCRLTFVTVDDNTTLIRAKAENTYNHRNTALLQLQFRLHDGGTVTVNGQSSTLSAERIEREGALRIAHNGWSASLPEGSRFEWPFYTYYPYGSVRVPENLHNAVGRAAVTLPDGEWVEVRIRVD